MLVDVLTAGSGLRCHFRGANTPTTAGVKQPGQHSSGSWEEAHNPFGTAVRVHGSAPSSGRESLSTRSSKAGLSPRASGIQCKPCPLVSPATCNIFH